MQVVCADCAVVLMQKYFNTQALARSLVSEGGKEPRRQSPFNYLFVERAGVKVIEHGKDSNQTSFIYTWRQGAVCSKAV